MSCWRCRIASSMLVFTRTTVFGPNRQRRVQKLSTRQGSALGQGGIGTDGRHTDEGGVLQRGRCLLRSAGLRHCSRLTTKRRPKMHRWPITLGRQRYLRIRRRGDGRGHSTCTTFGRALRDMTTPPQENAPPCGLMRDVMPECWSSIKNGECRSQRDSRAELARHA